MTTKRTGAKRKPLATEPAPIADRHTYEAGKRSTWHGIGDAALAGDREAIKDLAAMGATFMHSLATDGAATANSDTAAAAFWLASILADIQTGTAPDAAFGYAQAKHRPAEFAALRKQVMIGRHFNLLRAEGTKREVAKIEVAARWNVSLSYAAECGDALAAPTKTAKSRKK